MRILEVIETFGGRTTTQDRQWLRTYTRKWHVVTDSPYVGQGAVRGACPVRLGDAYVNGLDSHAAGFERDLGALCLNVEAVDTDRDGCQWLVTASYGPYDPTQFPQNPFDHPLKISWGFAQFEKTVERTAPIFTGNSNYPGGFQTFPIVNSAGDQFDPPVTDDDSRPILRIQRNEPFYDVSLAILYKDALNSDTFWGFDPGLWKSKAPEGEPMYSPDQGFYYSVSYEFHLNPDGWAKKILDIGLRTRDSTGLQHQITMDSTIATSPVLLDGNGGLLAIQGPGVDVADGVYLDFPIYLSVPFADLNLDPSGAPGQQAS